MQDPRRGCCILAAWLGCAACTFPDVEYESSDDDAGAADASGDASIADASRADATVPSDADAAADASVTEAGQSGADASPSLDAQADVEAGRPGPPLGTASNFAILAGTAVTSTGASAITGDLGVAPDSTTMGITQAMVTGTIHRDDAAAQKAQQDLGSAYDDLRLDDCMTMLSTDLGGLTLTPGVYCYPGTAAGLTGTLVLDAQGDASAVFVFQIGGALTTAADARVQMMNDGVGCNVFWQVEGAATIGAGTTFEGSLLATGSITLGASALLVGRALSETGTVTLSAVSVAGCP